MRDAFFFVSFLNEAYNLAGNVPGYLPWQLLALELINHVVQVSVGTMVRDLANKDVVEVSLPLFKVLAIRSIVDEDLMDIESVGEAPELGRD